MDNVAFTIFDMMSWADFHFNNQFTGSHDKLENC